MARPSLAQRTAHEARCSVGQAVVQFARGRTDRADYAIKFFLDEAAFQAEAALYAAFPPTDASNNATVTALECSQKQDSSQATGRPAAGTSQMLNAARFLPKVDAVCDGSNGKLVDPRGRPLPSCIVMEKGESLQDWSLRAEPDMFTSLAVRADHDLNLIRPCNACSLAYLAARTMFE